MLEPDWVRAHADEFDVFHLQFGFDARTPHELRELLAVLRQEGKPFVYTVHDLRNPHHSSRHEHDAQLDVLIPAADALITLTAGAAAEIERRWGRVAEVVPHPHVVDTGTMREVQAGQRDGRIARRTGSRRAHPEFRIGVHVKSLRASMNPRPVIETLIATARSLPGAVLQVDGHSDVLRPHGARYDRELAELLDGAAMRGELDLRVHDFFTDAELWHYLASLDASVLPYRFGTHSGWLEACRDLGTTVIAPDCGYYADQGPVFSYHHDEHELDAASLDSAVRAAALSPADSPQSVAESVDDRLRQRERIAKTHRRIYSGLLA